MSIATKTGDKGDTSLLSGERVRKDDIRVEAYGTVDELNSFLGRAKHSAGDNDIKELIEKIQKDLFRISAELADTSGKFKNIIGAKEIDTLDNVLKKYENRLKLTGFVIPGNSPGSADMDICRSLCRRAERRIISLDDYSRVSDHLKKYINRLSDLLFILARFIEKDPRYI